MRARKLAIAGSTVFIALLFIAGMLGVRLLCVAPISAKDQSADRTPISKPDHVLLPGSETAIYAKYYLADPKAVVQSWQPSGDDLRGLEANLPQISSMKENGRGPAWRIENPTQYFRQYLAIVQSGKRQIFVNAFCRATEGDSEGWHHNLQIVYDGGTCYWQVFYDPLTQKFSNLMINGVA
jgi:hypothetical protein